MKCFNRYLWAKKNVLSKCLSDSDSVDLKCDRTRRGKNDRTKSMKVLKLLCLPGNVLAGRVSAQVVLAERRIVLRTMTNGSSISSPSPYLTLANASVRASIDRTTTNRTSGKRSKHTAWTRIREHALESMCTVRRTIGEFYFEILFWDSKFDSKNCVIAQNSVFIQEHQSTRQRALIEAHSQGNVTEYGEISIEKEAI